jgi:hypothetical protein
MEREFLFVKFTIHFLHVNIVSLYIILMPQMVNVHQSLIQYKIVFIMKIKKNVLFVEPIIQYKMESVI